MLCGKMATALDKKSALVFWINNIDLVISIHAEYSQTSLDAEKAYFDLLMNQKTHEFVQEGF
jgi:hypothetical protein